MKKLELIQLEKIEGGQNGKIFLTCVGEGLIAGLAVPVIGGILALAWTGGCYYLSRK